MTCDNNTTTQAYVGPDAPDVTVGCLPSGLGEPTAKPESDQLPFYYDTKSESLYFFNCESNIWIKQNQVVGDLPSIDTDVISDICNVLQIPISYILNDCVSEGNVTLGTLANHIAECLGLEKRFSDLENRNPIKSISTGEDGKVTVTYIDGTTKALQIDTDQVTKVSENSNEIVYTNEDGTQFKVTATAIKRLIANDYVDNEELADALSSLDPDQVTKFAITGTNLIITNEDGSSVSVKRTDMVNWLNAGLATDVELANAITAINTDQAKLELESSDLKLTNEDGTSSSVALSTLTKALKGGNGINTSNGEVNVCLSSDAGNLLELREDPDTGEVCLYFGIQAPPNVYRQYVDAENGSDSATGTRSDPLKTVDEAFSRVAEDKSSYVYLKSSNEDGSPQVHEYDNDLYIKGSAVRSMLVYDDPYIDGNIYDCYRETYNKVYRYHGEKVTRPILRPKFYKKTVNGLDVQVPSKFFIEDSATLRFLGLDFELPVESFALATYPISGNYDRAVTVGTGLVYLQGSRVIDNNKRLILNPLDPRSPANFSFLNSQIITSRDYSDPDTESLIRIKTSVADLRERTIEVVAPDTTQCGEENLALQSNIADVLGQPGAISGITRVNGVPTNVTSSFPV